MKRFLRTVVLVMVLIDSLAIPGWAAEFLIPGGQIIGLQLQNDTVTIAAFDDSCGEAARQAGLKIGDEILAVDNCPVRCPEDIHEALAHCGDVVTVKISRNQKTQTVTVHPARTKDGPRLGIYLRQGIAGIGTVTWYDPEEGTFGTLGHGVSDSGGQLLRMTQGHAFAAEIVAVKKGKCGEPGQLKGTAEGMEQWGTLLRNTPQGVFGKTDHRRKGEPLPVAEFSDVHPGPATIRSTIAGDTPREYSVEILKIYPEDRCDNRNFLLRVTDPELLSTTGGIVQGMSGSPIIQDGKLIGAVTHVLVNDPTRGYGIFIENMLDAAG